MVTTTPPHYHMPTVAPMANDTPQTICEIWHTCDTHRTHVCSLPNRHMTTFGCAISASTCADIAAFYAVHPPVICAISPPASNVWRLMQSHHACVCMPVSPSYLTCAHVHHSTPCIAVTFSCMHPYLYLYVCIVPFHVQYCPFPLALSPFAACDFRLPFAQHPSVHCPFRTLSHTL